MNQNTKEFREKIANYFIKMLKEKDLEWKRNWNAISNVPVNATTGKKYKGINRFWLSIKAEEMGSDDCRWATFKQIQSNQNKGWKLKKGSKGVKVEYWQPYDFQKKQPLTWEEYARYSHDQKKMENIGVISKYYTVFNGKDITGLPALEHPKERQIVTDEIVHKISKSMEVPIYHDGGSQAFYRPTTDDIHLPKPGMFLTAYDYDCTALHELSHATGAEKRLNRNIQNRFGDKEYAYEELVAEISSCFMGEHLEIAQTEEHRKNHAAYVQGWIQEIKEKPETLIRAIRDAEQAANFLEFHAGLIAEIEYQDTKKSNREVFSREVDKNSVQDKHAATDQMVKELKKNGFTMTKTIADNVQKLNDLTGKHHSLKDIQSAFQNHSYQNLSQADKILTKLVKDLQMQERVNTMIPER